MDYPAISNFLSKEEYRRETKTKSEIAARFIVFHLDHSHAVDFFRLRVRHT